MTSCASDWMGPGTLAEQAVHTPNDDEERLEQMSHPKNQGTGTEDAPRKVEWTCLGLHAFGYGEWTCWGLYGMAMERSCSLWRRREFWDHSVPPNTTRSTRLCVGVTHPLPFLPQGQAMEIGARAHKQRTCPGNHPRSTPQKPMFRTTVVTCSRTHRGMDTDGLENGGSPQKKSPKKPINRMCLGEESTDDPHTVRQQSDISTTGQRQRELSKVVRDGVAGNSLRQSVSAQSTWPGCEVELGTCHCLPYDVHLVHPRIPGGSSPTTERYPLWW